MAVIKKEAYFTSSTGKDRIRVLIWLDDETEPRALFQISHGICEHIGRYDDFARFLASNGFIVFGNDHLGHGKSVADESVLGFTAERSGHYRLIDDMHILTRIMKKRYPELPLILFGNSMGSFCSKIYARLFSDELSGLILCGTSLLPPTLDFIRYTADDLVDKFGAHTMNEKLFGIKDKLSSLYIPNKESDLDWLSVSRQNIENYKNDPLCGFPLTLAAVRDFAWIAALASEPSWSDSVPTRLPIMIISGARDPLSHNGKAVLAVSDKLELTGHTTETILYPNCRHEILNENTDGRVYDDILGWLTEAAAV